MRRGDISASSALRGECRRLEVLDDPHGPAAKDLHPLPGIRGSSDGRRKGFTESVSSFF